MANLACSDRHIKFQRGYEFYRDFYGNVWQARISSPFYENSFRMGKMVAKCHETEKIERILADEQVEVQRKGTFKKEQGTHNKGVRFATMFDEGHQLEFSF